MNKRYLGLTALAFALCAGAGRADDKWKTFTPKGGKFSVLMPGKPQDQKKTVKMGDKSVDVFLFFSAPSLKQVVFVNYSDYPKNLVGGKEDAFLDGTAKGNVNSLKGKLVVDRKITVGKAKHPGREILIEVPDKKQQYRARIVLAGNRLFQVVAMGEADFVKGKQVDEYLESFKVEE